MTTHPLEWWKFNARNYPVLAQLARICLACPGSQIENERVFSLCGLTVSNLRNKMTTDNLAEVVYLTKNTASEETLSTILTKAYGQSSAYQYLHQRDEAIRLTHMPHPEHLAFLDDEGSDDEVEVEDEAANDTSIVSMLAFVANLDDAGDDSSETEASAISDHSDGGSFDEDLGL